MQDRGLLIYRRNMDGDVVEIYEDSISRNLYLGSRAKQSSMSLIDPGQLLLSYTRAMMSFLIFRSSLQRVLLLGLGGGSLAKFIHCHFPETEIVAVEKRQDIIEVAYKYFQLPRHENIQVVHDEALSYLQHCEQGFDAILVDAFDAGGMAAQLADTGFFRLCQQHLLEKGLVSMNVWGTNQAEYQAVSSSIAQVFPAVLQLPVEKKGNVIFLAMARAPAGHWHKTLAQHARQLGQGTGLELQRFLNTLYRVNTPLLRRLFAGG